MPTHLTSFDDNAYVYIISHSTLMWVINNHLPKWTRCEKFPEKTTKPILIKFFLIHISQRFGYLEYHNMPILLETTSIN